MSAVETLREAAQEMRSKAESATPGPWFDYFTVHGDPSVVADTNRPMPSQVCSVAVGPADYGRANAWHIAGMHPGVALAVADWLDEVARRSVEHDHVVALEHPEALAVARTYLGKTAEVPA